MQCDLSKVYLIGNYLPDSQYSMLQFSDLMERGLKDRGLNCECLRPEVVFGNKVSKQSRLFKWFAYIDKYVLFPRKLRKLTRGKTRDEVLFHICDHSNSVYLSQLRHFKNIVTCHDLMAIQSARGEIPQNPTGRMGRMLQNWIYNNLKSAQYIACDSESSRQDLIRLIPSKRNCSSRVFLCLYYPYRKLSHDEITKQLTTYVCESNSQYILHVGSDSWYKNRMVVLEVFEKMLKSGKMNEGRLLLAGPELSVEQRSFSVTSGIIDRIEVFSKITDEKLEALYSLADVLLQPSLYEGFGWPPLEAQACQCPVVGSHCGSLAEILESGAIIHEPNDVDGMSESALTLLNDQEFKNQLLSEGAKNVSRFSHERMIDEYVECYLRL